MSQLDDLNNARSNSTIRHPRPLVTVNGVVLTGVMEAEVTNASHFSADTFRIVAASSGLPATLGPDYWAVSAGDQVSVKVGFADDTGFLTNTVELIAGQVDDIDFDPIRRTLTLTGRDLSAPLIDTKTSEKFVNLTASQIAQKLAQRHNLNPSVTPTTTKVGTYYSIDHVMLTQEQTEWDLLTFLAEHEGYDLWVSGTTLHFEPSPVETAPPYKLICPSSGNPAANAVSIGLSRSQTLARDVTVIIHSWNQQQQKSFKVTYKVTKGYGSQRSGGLGQIYSYTVPNLTRDQAQKLAKSRADDITRHERVLTANLPGDNRLTTRAMIQLIGTNTAWDQHYYPDSVTRRISPEEGYRMDLRAKNHSTQSTVAL